MSNDKDKTGAEIQGNLQAAIGPKRIITPNNGKDRKVVGIDNKPLRPEAKPPMSLATDVPVADRIVEALRDLADRLENGELPEPEFVLLVPKFKDGDTSLLYFGNPVPTVVVEGTLHKVLTRMAMA